VITVNGAIALYPNADYEVFSDFPALDHYTNFGDMAIWAGRQSLKSGAIKCGREFLSIESLGRAKADWHGSGSDAVYLSLVLALDNDYDEIHYAGLDFINGRNYERYASVLAPFNFPRYTYLPEPINDRAEIQFTSHKKYRAQLGYIMRLVAGHPDLAAKLVCRSHFDFAKGGIAGVNYGWKHAWKSAKEIGRIT